MQQKRLVLALLISTVIIVLWTYLAPIQQPQPNSNSAPPVTQQPSPTTSPTPATQQPAPPVSNIAAAEQGPRRTVVIKTPLYEAKIDSQGAEVVSWIIKKNKNSGSETYSIAGNKNNKLSLELVSAEGLKRTPREAPLQLITGEGTLDALLSQSSYRIEGNETSTGDVELGLTGEEAKRLTFLLKDPASGLDVVKTLSFRADRYEVELEIALKRNDQIVPQAKVRIGPSVGDQGVSYYSFYSVAPEAIAFINGETERHSAQSINENKNSPDVLRFNGAIDWAGVGDTYFAMVAIPSQRMEGLEYRTTQYDHDTNGKKDKRYLVSAFIPLPTDGSKNVVYAGPKDHFLLTEASQTVSAIVGRQVDLDALIDYGWFRWLSRPLAVPILTAIKWLKDLTGNFGIAIILFTIVIYSLFFPLKWRSSKAMKKAQKLAPKMKEIQERIKGLKPTDPKLKELQIEQLKLMKEGNPLGGCLPLLIQMPFLFALYRAITISLDFRQATFLWLPDLSGGDPYHILEFLMAGTMVVLQLITPAPSADPLQRKMMAIGMPIFMLYVLWGAPSGLLLYWLVGNIVGFSQQFLINHLTKTDDDEPAPPPTTKRKGATKSKPLPA